MRSNGQVRFIKISAILQRRVAGTVAAVVGLWLLVTLGMMINQISVSAERMMLSAKQEKIETAAERVAKYRDDMEAVASDLEARQKLMEGAFEDHFGNMPAAEAAAPAKGEAAETAQKIGRAIPEAAKLAQLEARQIAFAERMTQIALVRSQKAERAIREFGLNPAVLARQAASGTGGPFIPFFGARQKPVRDPRFTRMLNALERMEALETALAGIPTSMPAATGLMSSRFGYRSDPFNGGAAMHAGLDFKGPAGTPILAAADGKVTSAGWQGGYGKCIEITHANGLVTRYAHLSGLAVAVGQEVKRGVQIGRMGSTGRSTGSHLHFEVRINGSAINPLKFLEANPDVLEIQAIAGNRSAGRGTAGA
jgi:murein DD-endopeptidase MepM/ murein hydrolase activator NlpD